MMVVALGTAAASGCGGGSKCCLLPADAAGRNDSATTKDSAATKDAPTTKDAALGNGKDASPMDASTKDAVDGAVGLPCPQSSSLASECDGSFCALTWDAIGSVRYYCRDGLSAAVFVTGTCGDYRVLEDNSSGDDVKFYYYDASGALTAIVTRSANKYQCQAGLISAITPAPCIDFNSAPKLVCSADAGARG